MERRPLFILHEDTKPKQATDKEMKSLFPLFVEHAKTDDHKCGSCSMRVEKSGDKAECTVVDGSISLSKGTCTYWAEGNGSSPKDTHEALMSKNGAGYVEAPSADFKIQCGTCKFFGDNYCSLWMRTVQSPQCCISYDSKHVKPVSD